MYEEQEFLLQCSVLDTFSPDGNREKKLELTISGALPIPTNPLPSFWAGCFFCDFYLRTLLFTDKNKDFIQCDSYDPSIVDDFIGLLWI